ncbi:MAG: 4-alpha-glucanotransferase, partial [Candidatus Nanopelagicales bacterium]
MAIWQAPHPEVVELAHALGVATEYFDQSGNHVAISQLTLEKVLAALKVDVKTAQGRKAAWDRINNDAWRRMLPHVVVCKQGEEKHFQVHVPDGAPVVVWVDLEQGGRQPLAQVDRYIPPRMIDGTLVGEATFATKSDLPLGWHTITAISEADPKNPMTASSVLVVTPSYLELPSKMRDRKTWGLMAQMYATRSEQS